MTLVYPVFFLEHWESNGLPLFYGNMERAKVFCLFLTLVFFVVTDSVGCSRSLHQLTRRRWVNIPMSYCLALVALTVLDDAVPDATPATLVFGLLTGCGNVLGINLGYPLDNGDEMDLAHGLP
ncbi:hypothetical protein MTO96_017872 [Rhipicephalus appendiculatus]